MPNSIPEALAITMYDDVIDKDHTVTEMRKEDCVLCSNRYHIGNSRWHSDWYYRLKNTKTSVAESAPHTSRKC